MALVSFFYSGMQMSVAGFIVAYLHTEIGMGLVAAGKSYLDVLQALDAQQDVRAGVLVETGIDVRGAGDGRDAVRHRDPRHFEGRRKVGCAVVDTGQEMAVEIDQDRFMP